MFITLDSLPAEASDPVLDSLLAREEISIVDGLLALPGAPSASVGPDRWARAVNSRLEARIAQRMRRTIGGAAPEAGLTDHWTTK